MAPSGPNHSSRVWASDYNGDGKLDLLVGDSVTLSQPAEGLTDDEFEKALGAWQKDIDDLGDYPETDNEKKRMAWQRQMSKFY